MQMSIEKAKTLIFEINCNINLKKHRIIDNSLFLDKVCTKQYSYCEVLHMTENEMIQLALEEGFAAAAIVDTTQIVFDPSFRPYCEENLCGQ